MTTKRLSRAQSVLLCGLALAAAGLAVLPVRAQSLADVARKEEERRKASGEPAKVYTNKDLHAVPPGSAQPAADTPAGDTPKAANGDAKAKAKDGDKAGDKADDKAAEKEPAKDKAYWSGRLKALQAQQVNDQDMADALQTRINSLTTDFTNRDDPLQRAKIDADRRRALTDLDRLKKAVVEDQKAIAALQEDARKAGVPPGWLR